MMMDTLVYTRELTSTSTGSLTTLLIVPIAQGSRSLKSLMIQTFTLLQYGTALFHLNTKFVTFDDNLVSLFHSTID